jgi:LacI family transcriptional regulator
MPVGVGSTLMAATIYDVAALAGVSPATVSRVLNGTAVSAERAQKVRDAAQALGFRPNRMARTLRKGGSEVIALVIPDVENSFFTALARGVEDRAMAAGYSVVLCNTDELVEKEMRYLEIAVDQQVAGLSSQPLPRTPTSRR